MHWARTIGRADGSPTCCSRCPAPETGAAATRRRRSASTSPATCAPGSASARRRGCTSPRSRPRRCRCAPRPPIPGCRSRSARTSRTAGPPSSTRSTSSASTRSSCPSFAHRIGAGFFEDRVTIGHWAWEASTVPDSLGRGVLARRRDLDLLGVRDERARRPPRRCRSSRCRSPVLPPRVADAAAPDLGLAGDAFTFLFSVRLLLDHAAQEPGRPRARPTRAPSGRSDGTQLVIKTFNGDAKPESLRELLRASPPTAPDVHVIDRFLPGRGEERAARRAPTATSRCTARRASGSRSPRRCCSASRWSPRATRATSSS